MFLHSHCRGRQLADPLARSALGFPRGEAAERSEADEGWRWLKVIDCLVKWWKLKHIPFIGLHSFTKLSPPLIRLFCQSVLKCRLSKNPASPRGKPRTQKTLAYTIQQAALLRGLRVAKLATPTELRDFWRFPFNEQLSCMSFGRLSLPYHGGAKLWVHALKSPPAVENS